MKPARARLPSELRDELLARAKESAPREACGLLLGRRTPQAIEIEALAELRNVSPTATAFELAPVDVLAIERAALASGREVVGAWHSHVFAAALPSERDLAHEGYGLALIVSLRDGDVRVWRGPIELELELV